MQIKSNFLLYSLNYAEACNEFEGPILKSLRPGNTATFEENVTAVASRRQHFVNLIGPRFEPQTFCSRDEGVTA